MCPPPLRLSSPPLVLCLLLAACGANQGDDLDQFMRDTGSEARSRIKPLPEVQFSTPQEFNPGGTLHDPFKPRTLLSKNNGMEPDRGRPREALEGFPLENLKFTGLLEKNKVRAALIKSPDGVVHQVTQGNYLGQNFGMIVEITDTEIKLKEIVTDDVSGDWVERSNSLNLQE